MSVQEQRFTEKGIVKASLQNLGYDKQYIKRSMHLYEKTYSIIKYGYDRSTIAEIIYRLQIKDELKQLPQSYNSKVNLIQALETMNFTLQQINEAIEEYNLYSFQPYDIRQITSTIMQKRAKYKFEMEKHQKKCPEFQVVQSSSISVDSLPSLPETTAKPIYPNIETFAGYLWKQSSKRRKWQKRWFVFCNGELQYFKNSNAASDYFQKEGGNYKTRKEYIGDKRECEVQKVEIQNYKYTFCITTPSQRKYVLKAADLNDYHQWFSMLTSTENEEFEHYSANDDDEKEYMQRKRYLHKIMNDNPLCADCNRKSPQWVSVNIGVVLCFECCSIHRCFGDNVSKIFSLALDNLNLDTLSCLVEIGGNEKLNKELFEYNLSPFDKIDDANCTKKERSEFIYNKYVHRMYVNEDKIEELLSFDEYLFNCAVNNDCFGVIYAIQNGANINHSVKELNNRTALQAAILKGNNEAIELLRNNEAIDVMNL